MCHSLSLPPSSLFSEQTLPEDSSSQSSSHPSLHPFTSHSQPLPPSPPIPRPLRLLSPECHCPVTGPTCRRNRPFDAAVGHPHTRLSSSATALAWFPLSDTAARSGRSGQSVSAVAIVLSFLDGYLPRAAGETRKAPAEWRRVNLPETGVESVLRLRVVSEELGLRKGPNGCCA